MPSSTQSSLDAATSGSIFRKDNPIILACNRHQALLLAIRVDQSGAPSTGYAAGTVMARNTSTGFYQAYSSGGSSGLNSAACVLMSDCAPASGNTDMAVGIFGGKVFENKLTGLDSTAKTALKSRSVVDAVGNQILIF